MLKDNKYITGPNFTIVDIIIYFGLFAFFMSMELGKQDINQYGLWDKYPKITAWMNELAEDTLIQSLDKKSKESVGFTTE